MTYDTTRDLIRAGLIDPDDASDIDWSDDEWPAVSLARFRDDDEEREQQRIDREIYEPRWLDRY